ncbi:MAG: hypothetical protein AAB845_00340 [Patescibacteria group bacterium]
MDIKIFFALASSLISVVVFVNYLQSVLRGQSKPHMYTWLIWSLTQGIAVAVILYGKGGWGGIGLITSTLSVFCIFLLSLKYGTKNITTGDTIALILALLAIIPWLIFSQPLISILLVILIDFFGYIPSWRKSIQEPWSESLLSWGTSPLSYVFALLALSEYNALTILYPAFVILANYVLVGICLIFRQRIPKPQAL